MGFYFLVLSAPFLPAICPGNFGISRLRSLQTESML
jgi:hypothetical protein